MTLQENAVAGMAANMEMLKRTIDDFSDADLLVRPVPAANHAAWQIGHMISSETRLVNAVSPGAMPALPAGFEARFTKDTAKLDAAAAFPSKADLLAVCQQQRQAAIAWAKSLTQSDLDRPTPEPMRARIPNVASLMLLIPVHLAMHLGQIQVIRRTLGKPILF